jgi:hypothetical protein
MTTLPARIDDAVDTVGRWVMIVQERMTAPASREWLEAMLRQYLRQGLIETLRVVEAANSGDEIADAALRRVYAEMTDAGIEPPTTLKAYGINAVLRGPVTRKPGRNSWFDNWRRDIGICVLVYLTMQHFGLRPTRNRAQRRRDEPSASSIVAVALGRARMNVAEKRVENLWGSGLGAQITAYALRHFGIA